MIRHVVMWKFKPDTKQEQERFLTGLESLQGVIPEIISSQVGRSCGGDGCYDAVLIADFESTEALIRYQNDPRHLRVAGICKEIRSDRVAVDFEV